jgi:hypothetical protein
MFSDYLNALHASTNGKLLHVPDALWRLGLSRIVYKLGPRPYSLFRLWSKTTSTWSDYLDDSPLKPLMRSLSSANDREVIVDKILFYKECTRHNLSTVPIVGIFRQSPINDQSLDLPEIKDPRHLQAILDAHPDGLFCKPHDGTHGIGAFVIARHTWGWRFPGGVGDTQRLFKYCSESAVGGVLLVQPRLMNAASLRPLMAEGGFGTVRAVTYMDDGKPRLLAACLRLIAEGNAADNFGHGSTGNFIAPIEPLSGRLLALRVSRSKTWPLIYDTDRHPVSSISIVGFEIPYWNDCIDLVLRSQKAFNQLHSIGWDVGITKNGPILVEGNAQYDFDLLQVAFDRGFRPELERVVTTYQNQKQLPSLVPPPDVNGPRLM